MLNTKEFPEKAGRIFPPIVKIEYGEVTIKDLEAGGSEKLHQYALENVISKKACNAGPDCETVDDDNEHPRKDAHRHFQLRVGVRVVFVALDEVSTAGGPGEPPDGNWEGDC